MDDFSSVLLTAPTVSQFQWKSADIGKSETSPTSVYYEPKEKPEELRLPRAWFSGFSGLKTSFLLLAGLLAACSLQTTMTLQRSVRLLEDELAASTAQLQRMKQESAEDLVLLNELTKIMMDQKRDASGAAAPSASWCRGASYKPTAPLARAMASQCSPRPRTTALMRVSEEAEADTEQDDEVVDDVIDIIHM